MFNLLITLNQIFINFANEKAAIKLFPVISFGEIKT